MLFGRDEEMTALTGMLDRARGGESSALVIIGQPGIGKTALLDYAAQAATGMRVLRGTAIESETELPYAALHLLLKPLLPYADKLPERLGTALLGAFGLAPEGAGDPFLVGLAVLTLLSELAEESPLLCLVDDAQWLDQASSEALLFAARRLEGEGIVLIFARRETGHEAPVRGLASMRLEGLDPRSAADLLEAQGTKVGAALAARIHSETEGNPLALIELPALLATDFARDSYLVRPVQLTGRVREAFHQQVRSLPEATGTLMLVAAAGGTGDLSVLLRAAGRLGAGVADLHPAEERGLVSIDAAQQLIFRHPLIRAATYHGATTSARLAVHAALAEALEAPEHADRRAWHLALAATGPDERVAVELEKTAARAAARIGHAAAAAAYERAAQLGTDHGAIGRRLTFAAEAAVAHGAFGRAGGLAQQARERTSDPVLIARLDQIRAIGGLAQGELRVAHDILAEGARSIAELAPQRAFWMLMEALHCAWFLPLDAELLGASIDRLATLALDPDDPLLALVWLLRWDTAMALERDTADFPPIAGLMDAARGASGAGGQRGLVSAAGCALLVAQDEPSREMASTLVEQSRAQGTITWLAPGLAYLAEAELFLGRHREVHVHLAEASGVARDTGQLQWLNHINGVTAYIAAVQGAEENCLAHVEEALSGATAGAGSVGIVWAQWGRAMLDLSLGRMEAALTRFEEMARGRRRHLIPGVRSLTDHVEAAVRAGRPELAAEPYSRFAGYARRMNQPSLDALERRCLALRSPDDEAERLYLEALALHDADSRQFEHARTRLLYGEWLRRGRRKSQARGHLEAALEAFTALGAAPWAQRARAELAATGAVAPRGATDLFADLTPQELQIVRLAAQGMSNRDIAAQLFLSPKTVAYHLYKAYPKLGVSSRGELSEVR
ncbi:ATP-binding protein [Nonomuraea sp. NPDC050663]|uniref:ATP-binding protein n=1 Tax=Nonomuraea sp. NPDC050663 TaxID=3364370 RepID=UPI0037B9BFB3